MDFTFFAGIAASMIICFVLRVVPRIGRPFIGHDTWSILLIVDELKKGNGYYGASKYFLIKGENDYPPLLFYFLSLIPSRWLRRYNWIINPILDSLNACLVFGVTYVLADNAALALAATTIYSFTPVVLEESLDLNVRTFGLVIFNLTLVTFMLYRVWGNSIFLASAIIFGILVLLSHKFATQVLYLLMLSFAITQKSYVPLLALGAMIAGALLLSGGFYMKILLGHIGIVRFWLKHYKDYGSDYLSKSTVGKAPAHPPKEMANAATSHARALWHRTKWINPLYWTLKINPFNPFALIPLLMIPSIWFAGNLERGFLEWSVLTLGFYYAATHFRFLGHYVGRSQFLEYNAFPTAYLCSIFATDPLSYWKILTISIVFLSSAIQNIRSLSRVRIHNRSDNPSLLANIFEYLKKSTKDGVICLPSSHTFAVPYFSGKKVFYTMNARNYDKLGAFFPVLTVPLKTLIEEFDISFVIVDTTIIPVSGLDLNGFQLAMEENGYALLER